jgi:hypothetical protein
MKPPRKWTREEWREWRRAADERFLELQAHIDRIKKELADHRKSA